MKIPIPGVCPECRCRFSAHCLGDGEIPPAVCPNCGEQIYFFEPPSVSPISDRLLYRSEHELSDGDYTLSIICSAIAVETALSQAFLKWKRIEHGQNTKKAATESELNAWEREYRKQGAFEKSANFLAVALVGKSFDKFVDDFLVGSRAGARIKAGLPRCDQSQLKLHHICGELFKRRNRIMHWGKMDYQMDDARSAFQAGRTALAILKIMDKEKAQAMERAWRAVPQASAR